MKAFIICGIFFSLIQQATANEKRSLTGLFNLNGSKVTGKLNEANVFGLSVNLDFKHRLSSLIGINANGGVSLEAGESESKYSGRNFRPSNSLSLRHAFVEINPLDNIRLELGAINQSYHNNPLFLTSTAFVSAREVFSIEVNQWKFELDMIQGIPSNYSLSQRIGNVKEGSSRFFNEKIRVIGSGDTVSVEASIGHFAFDRLNSSIAYHSRLLGNTVSGVGSINNKFKQKYIGFNSDLKISYKRMSLMDISIEAAAHRNEMAASGKNLGYIIGPVLTSKSLENDYSFEIKTLKNESDSTVAYYSSKYVGQTNREGLMTGLSIVNKAMSLEYGINAYLTKPIEFNSFQEKERIIYLSLRKSYDFL
ncbi:MAG: hypothetical protein ACJAT2_003822 [Bacteriovoracaceae bacterium]